MLTSAVPCCCLVQLGWIDFLSKQLNCIKKTHTLVRQRPMWIVFSSIPSTQFGTNENTKMSIEQKGGKKLTFCCPQIFSACVRSVLCRRAWRWHSSCRCVMQTPPPCVEDTSNHEDGSLEDLERTREDVWESYPSFLLGLCASTKVTSPAFLIRSFRSCCKPQRRLSDRENTRGCLAFQTCKKKGEQADQNSNTYSYQLLTFFAPLISSHFSGGRVNRGATQNPARSRVVGTIFWQPTELCWKKMLFKSNSNKVQQGQSLNFCTLMLINCVHECLICQFTD